MEDHFVIHLAECARCGCKSFEVLRSHSYCVNCNYSPGVDAPGERSEQIPDWALQALGSSRRNALASGVA